jgi:heme/copper-type cytochrome/quinol oxidase subunit 2
MECGKIESDLNICYKTLICQYTSGERILFVFMILIGILGMIFRITINVMKKKNKNLTKKEKEEFNKKMKTFSIISHIMSIPIYALTVYFIYLLFKYKADLSKPCLSSLKSNSSTPIVISKSDDD